MTVTEPCGCAAATNSQLEASEASGHTEKPDSSPHYRHYPQASSLSLSLPRSLRFSGWSRSPLLPLTLDEEHAVL